MIMKKTLVLFFIALFYCSANAQELRVNVSVKAQEIKTVDPRVFTTLQRSVEEFFNNTQWTQDEFEDEEKIEADIQITITQEVSTTVFIADFVFQVIRPVYGSNYSTQIFNHIEKGIQFEYQELQPIQDNSQNYTDNLSSIFTFYAYILVGVDYDSFSPQGGDDLFQAARGIIANASTGSSDSSWENKGGLRKSRAKLLADILNPSVVEYRQAFYEYHRLGLDIMGENPVKGRAAISGAMQKIKSVERAFPNSMILKIFADCKMEELVQIFIPATTPEKNQIYDALIKLDPAQADNAAALKK